LLGGETNDGGFKARAGALTLLYLASPMKRSILLTLLAEATTGAELLDEDELPDPNDPIDLSIITDPYLVEPADPDFEPGAPIGPDTMLQPSPAGREMAFVGDVLQRWLDDCPDGPIELGPDAGPALSALLSGWCSTVIHTLAAEPLTTDEVYERIQILDLDVIEDQIESMEETGLLEAVPSEDGKPRYAPTVWLRQAIAPLAAAARVEHRHPPGDTAAIAVLDAEAAFLLTLPLLELPEGLSGTCSLAVDLDEGVSGDPAGVTARVDGGRVVFCEAHLDEDVDTWASAPAAAWLDTVIEADARFISVDGDLILARALLHGLHEALFGIPVG
jgi:hypothetical protein